MRAVRCNMHAPAGTTPPPLNRPPCLWGPATRYAASITVMPSHQGAGSASRMPAAGRSSAHAVSTWLAKCSGLAAVRMFSLSATS